MSQWTPVNKTWREYYRENATCDLVGRVIKLQSDKGSPTLLGDANANGGYCDDCSIRDDDIVLEELDLREQIDELIKGAEP